MVIDIEELKNCVTDKYAKQCEIAEKIKNDRTAIKTLTLIETKEIRDIDIIDAFVRLAKEHGFS